MQFAILLREVQEYAKQQNVVLPIERRYFYGARHLLRWLAQRPGDSLQEKWIDAEPDLIDLFSLPWVNTEAARNTLRLGLNALLCLKKIQPSYWWLSQHNFAKLREGFEYTTQKDDFLTVKKAARELNLPGEATLRSLRCLTYIIVHTGKRLNQIEIKDLDKYELSRKELGRKYPSSEPLYAILRHLKIISGPVRTRSSTVDSSDGYILDIIRKYGVTEDSYVEVFRRYFEYRSLNLAKVSIKREARLLLDLFWDDVKHHSEGSFSFRIPYDKAQEWKIRIRDRDKIKKTQITGSIFETVRKFYEFINAMAIEQPSIWGHLNSECPVSSLDIYSQQKIKRLSIPKRHRRTLELISYVPNYLNTLKRLYRHDHELIEKAKNAEHMAIINHGGISYQRVFHKEKQKLHNEYGRVNTLVVKLDGSGDIIDLYRREQALFWCWSLMEIIFGTGLRCREAYALKATDISRRVNSHGRLVPCFRIPASKTEQPRIVDLSPRVLAVIGEIFDRVQGSSSTYPLAERFDGGTSEYTEPQPFLLQKHASAIRLGFTGQEIAGWLKIVNPYIWKEGSLPKHMCFTPKDGRHIFATQLYRSGISIIDIARLLGHTNIATTMRYLAVEAEDLTPHLHNLWGEE